MTVADGTAIKSRGFLEFNVLVQPNAGTVKVYSSFEVIDMGDGWNVLFGMPLRAVAALIHFGEGTLSVETKFGVLSFKGYGPDRTADDPWNVITDDPLEDRVVVPDLTPPPEPVDRATEILKLVRIVISRRINQIGSKCKRRATTKDSPFH